MSLPTRASTSHVLGAPSSPGRAGPAGAAPAIPEGRESERARIIEAVVDLLGDVGLDGLTVRAVLARAGVNRRTFYEHFLGKDDLVLAAFGHSLQRAAQDCRERFDGEQDPLARLRAIVDYLVLRGPPDRSAHAGRRSAALCREHIRLAEARPAELQAALQPLTGLIAEQLAAGMALGSVRQGSPERMAALLYNLVSTTVHAAVLAGEGEGASPGGRTEPAEELWTFCLGGIR